MILACDTGSIQMGGINDRPSMTAAELVATGQAMFGARWVKPLARAVGRSPRAVRFWRQGERRIPEAAAAKIRALGLIGPIGVIVRRAVREIIPGAGAWAAHRVAQRAVFDLAKAGLLEEPQCSPCLRSKFALPVRRRSDQTDQAAGAQRHCQPSPVHER